MAGYMNKSKSDNWATPQAFYEKLHKEFNFNFDPCPLNNNELRTFDGLSSDWGTRTFCNPPYSDWGRWVKKGYEEHLKGKLVVFLLPVRTDTIVFHDYILGKAEIRFIRGRLKFGDGKYPAPFPSYVVIFRGAK